MIVQMVPKNPNTKISVLGETLICEGFRFHIGEQLHQVNEKNYNLEAWRGKTFRLWIGDDSRLTTESQPTQYALLAEVNVPDAYNEPSGEVDQDGNPIMAPVALDLAQVEVRVWPIPD